MRAPAALLLLLLAGCPQGYAGTYATLDVEAKAAQVAREALPEVSRAAQDACRSGHRGDEAAVRACLGGVRAAVRRLAGALSAVLDKTRAAVTMVSAAERAGAPVRSVYFWAGEAMAAYLAAQQVAADLGYKMGGL